VLVFLSFITACHDAPLGPTAAGPVANAPRAARNVSEPGATSFGCFVTSDAPGETQGRRHSRLRLAFPSSTLSPAGAVYRFTYRSYADGAKLNRLLICEVPATRTAVGIAYLRLGIQQPVPLIADKGNPGEQIGTLGDEDTAMLDPLVVTGCQYGGTYPECNPKPIDANTFLNDCSLYGVCGSGGSWNFGPGEGGGGTEGGVYNDGGPFLAALTCIIAYAATGASMLDVANAYAAAIIAGRRKGEAERTYNMYVQQPTTDVSIQIHLEGDANSAAQAYHDAVESLAGAMKTSFYTAAGSALACGGAFVLPTP
jgi:hypothetical protein